MRASNASNFIVAAILARSVGNLLPEPYNLALLLVVTVFLLSGRDGRL